MKDALQHILNAHETLTLASAPNGYLPWLATDLARAAFQRKGRAVVIAADEAALRALADTAPIFAPEVEILTLPGWDCLPYDRSSPALRVMAERLGTLARMQEELKKPQLLITTATAVSQRLLSPFRVRQLTKRLAEGSQIARDELIMRPRPSSRAPAFTAAGASPPGRSGPRTVNSGSA